MKEETNNYLNLTRNTKMSDGNSVAQIHRCSCHSDETMHLSCDIELEHELEPEIIDRREMNCMQNMNTSLSTQTSMSFQFLGT